MPARNSFLALPLVLLLTGCDLFGGDASGGSVTISIQQSLTGETSSAGTFVLSGALADEGQTSEVIVFAGPLDQPVVPITFTRTMVGARGEITVTGSATLTFSSPTSASISGTWSATSGTGRYASISGAGSLTGAANFGASPPSANLAYTGELRR